MRLLNTSNYKLQAFFGDDIPDYAILSHRWEDEEVSLHDLADGGCLKMAGFAKIKGCCAQAASDGFQYVWIDTCCIDKTSSAELSEAINSMYQWYQNAIVCYAYLSDILKGATHDKHFWDSKWFTRGWTLQELLAPSSVVFYDVLWNEIGTKHSLEIGISLATGIRSLAHANQASIAEKMSWASGRETTRAEDMAYCLMGLFGVHMALLYGEGHNAFIRLQLEILNKSDDESIFAWTEERGSQGGLLASSPKAFTHSEDIELLPFDVERPQYSMTNKGLRLELLLMRVFDSAKPRVHSVEYLAPLNCGRRGKNGDAIYPVALKLRQYSQNQYLRIHSDELESWIPPNKLQTDASHVQSLKREVVHVKQPSGSESNKLAASENPVFFLKTASLLEAGFWISETFSFCQMCNIWNIGDEERPTLTIYETPVCTPHEKNYGALVFLNEDSVSFAVVLELRNQKNAGADILVQHHPQPLKTSIQNFCRKQAQGHLNLSLDRVSKYLPGDRSVFLALRGISSQQYLVDFGLGSTGQYSNWSEAYIKEVRDAEQYLSKNDEDD